MVWFSVEFKEDEDEKLGVVFVAVAEGKLLWFVLSLLAVCGLLLKKCVPRWVEIKKPGVNRAGRQLFQVDSAMQKITFQCFWMSCTLSGML